jgi:hypothetical protein
VSSDIADGNQESVFVERVHVVKVTGDPLPG